MAELELRVDRIGCDGAGLCAELLPELISLDEWGYPIVRPGAVPAALLEHASRAVDACPVLALRLAPVRGRTRTAAVLAAPGRAGSGGSPVAATPAMATAPRPRTT